MRTRCEAVRNAWKSDEDDRGAVLFILVLFLVIFIAVAAVAVDLAATGARGQELQNTSDAAALAGVVAYGNQVLANADPTNTNPLDPETVALAAVEEVMALNGVNPAADGIDVQISVSDDGTQLTVTVLDTEPDEFLPNSILGETLKPGDRTVERTATAEFLPCPGKCTIRVEIPEPFRSVSARGDGDGYKPIFVGKRLYAINHNSRDRHIVCVDRVRQEPCWPEGPFRPAYDPAVSFNDRNPEMPHTAVVGTRIYWSVTDSTHGLRLFCWETSTDIPCTTSVTLDSSLLRIDEEDSPLTNDKDENRGSGTVEVGDKVYVFSDNHRVHCYNPATLGVCSGFSAGGNLTAYGLADFPANDPEDGNHGSSIDRIVDQRNGYIYSTIHIPNPQPTIDCSSPLPDPAGHRVVIKNQGTDRFLASDFPDSVYAEEPAEPNTEVRWWDAENFGSETLTYQSVKHGEYLDAVPFGTTSIDQGEDDRWNNIIAGTAYYIDSEFGPDIYGRLEDVGGFIVEDIDDPPTSPDSEWNFYPWQCGDDSFDPGPPSPDYYNQPGTWLHCYDTGHNNVGEVVRTPGPCPGFTVSGVDAAAGASSPIHPDGSRFSGRLWFYYNGGANPTPEGVCSSGYGTTTSPNDVHINCVDLDTGAYDETMTRDMDPVRNEIRDWTGTNPGAWGDPHRNPSQNRLFYPTEHNTSRIICFDFDTGPCTGTSGSVEPNPSGLTATEDYGFVSDGNCVFALGHNAFFWAFKASDINERCDTQPLPTEIKPCPCGLDEFRWGQIDFGSVDLSLFDQFAFRIMTDDSATATPIYPFPSGWHSIKPGGQPTKINLDDLNIPDTLDSISIEVFIEGAGGVEIADLGSFDILVRPRPKLVD